MINKFFSASSISIGLRLPREISPGVCTLLFKRRRNVLRGMPYSAEARLIGIPSRIAPNAVLNFFVTSGVASPKFREGGKTSEAFLVAHPGFGKRDAPTGGVGAKPPAAGG